MLTDRYNLSLSTASTGARDAYVEGCDLALTFYPGAARAYDRAIAADPGFALAHAGKAQVLMRGGSFAAARAALTAAKDAATGHRVIRPGTRPRRCGSGQTRFILADSRAGHRRSARKAGVHALSRPGARAGMGVWHPIYIAACAAVSLVSAAFMPDYTGKDISMEYDDTR
jgi:hypothetical protein